MATSSLSRRLTLTITSIACIWTVFSIRQCRAPQSCGGCSAYVTHRAGRVVGHPMVLKSRLRFGQEPRFGLRQSVGVVLRSQALRWLLRRVVSSAEDKGRD